jgi:hypothetical protein
MFFFWNEFKYLRGKNFKMYIIEEMLIMNFNFFILTNYEFLTLSSKFYIKPKPMYHQCDQFHFMLARGVYKIAQARYYFASRFW